MLENLPEKTQDLMKWTWLQIEPFYKELSARELHAANIKQWLLDWSRLSEHVSELNNRLTVATTVDTADKEAEDQFNTYLDNIYPSVQAAEQVLKEKLLASRLEPDDLKIPLRNMQAEADLFRQSNLPLLAEEQKINIEYDKIKGAQTITWQGEERTLRQMLTVFQNPDRDQREKAWQAITACQLADRQVINDLWLRYMGLRRNIAANAEKQDFRAYQWQRLLRFDYTPENCFSFHKAIEATVVPVAKRIYARRSAKLGVDKLRPWDLIDGWYDRPVNPPGVDPLKPFKSIEELQDKTASIFRLVDPQLSKYFETMIAEGLLDLDNRKNKAPGGYCTSFDVVRRPFIFMNAVGLHCDIQTLLHEGGHSFHVFETANLRYFQQLSVPMEFAEVASMGMELLASPYLSLVGMYTPTEAARARIEHLEGIILFWPFMAVVDAFQHWVYENPQDGAIPDKCDTKWGELWDRFMLGVDWDGLDDARKTGWQRKDHIHQSPFYYVEYGLAQLGSVQIWANALKDQAGAVGSYRKALALGGTVTLPELFAAAGAEFAFDSETLMRAVDLMEKKIVELEKY